MGGLILAVYELEEWLAELTDRFGDDRRNWAFQCPACGKVSTMQDFIDVGGYGADASQKCIGRVTGKGEKFLYAPDDTTFPNGCDWVVNGFLGDLGKGDIVTLEDGQDINVFRMADAPGVKMEPN